MGICVGKKGKIILLKASNDEQFENGDEMKNRIFKFYDKNSKSSSSYNNELRTSFPSFNSTEFSEINNGFVSDINNNNTFKEILDLFNVPKD